MNYTTKMKQKIFLYIFFLFQGMFPGQIKLKELWGNRTSLRKPEINCLDLPGREQINVNSSN